MPDIFGASGQFSIDALGAQNQQALNPYVLYGPGGFGGTYGQYAPYPSFGEPSGPGSVNDVFTRGAPAVPYIRSDYYHDQPAAPAAPAPAPSAPGSFQSRWPSPSDSFMERFSPPSNTFQQRWPDAVPSAAPGNQDPVALYYDLMRNRGSNPNAIGWQSMLLGNATPTSLGAAPSPPGLGAMGPRPSPTQMFSIDPHLEFNPYNPNQPQGFGQYRTLDQNIYNPLTPEGEMKPQPQRDQIAQAIMNQPQVAQGVS